MLDKEAYEIICIKEEQGAQRETYFSVLRNFDFVMIKDFFFFDLKQKTEDLCDVGWR